MAVSGKVASGEIAWQQVLLQDGSVFSVQWLVVPGRSGASVTGRLLLDRYLRFVRTCTLSLVCPVAHADGIKFRLVASSLAFLRFAPPEYERLEQGGAVHLHTVGGLLVRAGEPGTGRFSFFTVPEDGGLRITLQLLYCRPLLLGSGHPSRLRRFCFSATQGRIHRALTVRFLCGLYRELTGETGRVRVKQVKVREGEDI